MPGLPADRRSPGPQRRLHPQREPQPEAQRAGPIAALVAIGLNVPLSPILNVVEVSPPVDPVLIDRATPGRPAGRVGSAVHTSTAAVPRAPSGSPHPGRGMPPQPPPTATLSPPRTLGPNTSLLHPVLEARRPEGRRTASGGATGATDECTGPEPLFRRADRRRKRPRQRHRRTERRSGNESPGAPLVIRPVSPAHLFRAPATGLARARQYRRSP